MNAECRTQNWLSHGRRMLGSAFCVLRSVRCSMRSMLCLMGFSLFIIALAACSGTGGGFSIDARFLNMNQANFYVYSPDGVIDGIDTIGVQAGRFTYSRDEIAKEGTIVIVFPNYATMPIFVKPGDDITIKADAAHLRGMEITGSEDNETFTEWRKTADGMSPVEQQKHAEQFIENHPESAVSRWLLTQYFVLNPKPDLAKARKMLKAMLAATDNNINVAIMQQKLNSIGTLGIGDPLPRFTAKDINGEPVLNGKFQKGTTIICLWASWSSESTSMLRQIAYHQRSQADSLKLTNVLTICLDPSVRQCRNTLSAYNAENLTTVCDTMMWDSPLIKTLGLTTVPDNIRLKNGKVTDRHAPIGNLLKNK